VIRLLFKFLHRALNYQLRYILFQFRSNRIDKNHARELNRLRIKVNNKEPIKIVFLVIHHSVWKLEQVYQRMMKDDFFDPEILICPNMVFGNEQMHEDLNSGFDFFKSKGYVVNKALGNDGSWVKIQLLNPDIIFFTNPYPLTISKYYQEPLKNYLSCYLPYYFMATNHAGTSRDIYSSFFLGNVWKVFWPHNYHLENHKKFNFNNASNGVVSGYPSIESLVNKEDNLKDPWKPQKNQKKRIIIAPHHTITQNDEYSLSSFLELSDYFIELALKYRESVQWSFKPHPMLKPNLINHPDWGKVKTENYFSFWKNNDFTQLDEGDYIALFHYSDAIMHDSSSFICEYVFTEKPGLYLMEKIKSEKMVNDFGQMFLSTYQVDKRKSAINQFVHNVISGVTLLETNQNIQLYISNYYKDNKPSDLILQEIKNELIR